MNKTNIVIGTTSLNRPILHNDIFPDWITWINSLDKNKYEITWFINIDIIKKLGATYEETVENFDRLSNGLFKIKFLRCEGDHGNFLKACQRLASNIKEFVDTLEDSESTKIIWLEDDWKLNLAKTININEIINTYSGNLTHINLTFIRPNYIHALAPSIISYNLWKLLHYEAWTNQIDNVDPEHCVGSYYIKNFGKYIHVNNITIANRPVDDKFLNQTYVNEVNSFYSFNNDKYILPVNNDKYVKKQDIKTKFNDVITFIRISPTICIDGCDYGRKFMEKYELEKNKGKYCENFYNDL